MHDDHVTVGLSPSPLVGSQVEHMVEIEVRKEWAE
jgi:hypothetical protein